MTQIKHRRRGKFTHKYIWSFKKSFKKDYLDREKFNKNKHKILQYGQESNEETSSEESSCEEGYKES